MKQEDFWRNCLPPNAPEREFLRVAEAERPPPEAAERGWVALCAAAGIATATTVAAPGLAAAATTATTKLAAPATAAVVGKTALGVVGASVVAKTVAVGFVAGMGILGTGYAVSHESWRRPAPAVVAPEVPATHRVAPSARPLSSALGISVAAPSSLPSEVLVPRAASAPLSESVNEGVSRGGSRAAAVVEPKASVGEATDSLASQAEQFAWLKRRLDSGAASEVAHQLQGAVARAELSLLAEDRDALLVEAWVRSGRLADAERVAGDFFRRYPSSPHRQRLRALLSGK